MNYPKRFEIWLVNWNPARGSEQEGIRPALVVQTDAGNTNPHYPNTIVLAISTKGREIPFHIKIKPSTINGLKDISYVKCEQILTISKGRLVEKIGILDKVYAEEIERALKLVLGLEP
ncbi:MAG TPA: type II toxin-antitoxin system PemK/MazF family toxin [Caldisericia bacterium]|jgi:mRNA interferase MazF|nr:type II toxin-antitoxin system PemK/MazF family toxin [Caldisericia bacterium]